MNNQLLASLLSAGAGAAFQPYQTQDSVLGRLAPAIGQAVQYNPWASQKENTLYGVGGALASAILGGVAEAQTRKRNAEVAPLLSALMEDPSQATALIQSNPEHAGKLQPFAMNLIQQQAEAQKEAEAAAKKALLEEQKYERQRSDKLEDGMRMAAYKNSLPTRPQIVQNIPSDGEMMRADGDLIGKSISEFDKLDEVKAFSSIDNSYRSLKQVIDGDRAMDDREFVVAAVQAIEPGLAVKENEERAILNSRSLPDVIKGYYRKAVEGKSGLGPEQRQVILDLVIRRRNEFAMKAEAKRQLRRENLSTRLHDPKAGYRISPFDFTPLPTSGVQIPLKAPGESIDDYRKRIAS